MVAATTSRVATSRPGSHPTLASRLSLDLPFQVRHGSRSRPQVALTFHGEGEPELAEAVLASAEEAGARVTVMAVGAWLDTYPEIAGRIMAGGHDLGNHTQHHVDISTLSAEAVYKEIDGCAQRLQRLTGSRGVWFRPSHALLATPQVQQQARKAGYTHCLSYDVDSLDHGDPGAESVCRTVLSTVRPGSVVSMHMGCNGTLAALPAILDELHRRGLEAVTATRLLRP
jgi:peptidoglycan/xylan/chitin deacetylase (PgdA/CDA1 family)